MPGQPFYNHYDDPDEEWDEAPLQPTRRSEQTPRPAEPPPFNPPPLVAPARPGESATGSRPSPKPMPKDFPPVVYLPVLTEVHSIEDAQIMMRQTRDGRVACMAYSALDRLHECCGSDQPWMWTTTVSLDALYQARPFDILLLDVYIPEEHRNMRA
ncbi:SAV_915 family protein [Nocardia sp. NPDC127579]|uniref:SAV_915 family protein n=1 Tax=Nocardia sp. NPDC127579 TaxID=3345402 RepID=UPI00363CC6B6